MLYSCNLTEYPWPSSPAASSRSLGRVCVPGRVELATAGCTASAEKSSSSGAEPRYPHSSSMEAAISKKRELKLYKGEAIPKKQEEWITVLAKNFIYSVFIWHACKRSKTSPKGVGKKTLSQVLWKVGWNAAQQRHTRTTERFFPSVARFGRWNFGKFPRPIGWYCSYLLPSYCLAGPRKLFWNYWQNIATDGKKRSVVNLKLSKRNRFAANHCTSKFLV